MPAHARPDLCRAHASLVRTTVAGVEVTFIASFEIGVGRHRLDTAGRGCPAVRGQAATVDWLANFALIEIFPLWRNAICLSGVLAGLLPALALTAHRFRTI